MKANRETIVLVAAACAMTFVLAHHAGTQQAPVAEAQTAQVASAAPASPHQVWTGDLAQVAPATVATPVEPMSSASLVVPKSALALPGMPKKAATKVIVPPVPPARTQVASNTLPTTNRASDAPRDDGLLHTLNPMNHLPDLSTVRRPFAYAGETISGWMRQF